MQTFLPVLALLAPFVAFLIEVVLPYPYVVEELIKFFLILAIPLTIEKRNGFLLAAWIGVGFAISETVFYSTNLFLIGVSGVFSRLIITSILHSSTSLVMFVSKSIHKSLIGVGLVLAILIHYYYNLSLL